MSEKPLIFSSPMVRAILAGRKTVTRRIMKPQPVEIGGVLRWKDFAIAVGDRPSIFGPWTVGDLIWVRETWLFAIGEVFYRATDADDPALLEEVASRKWKPSIHMPRWAARLFLDVIDVRAERLQDITEEDAIKEGVGHGFTMNGGWPDYEHINKSGVCERTQDDAIASFQSLWNSLHGPGAWERNPSVWRIEFERAKR